MFQYCKTHSYSATLPYFHAGKWSLARAYFTYCFYYFIKTLFRRFSLFHSYCANNDSRQTKRGDSPPIHPLPYRLYLLIFFAHAFRINKEDSAAPAFFTISTIPAAVGLPLPARERIPHKKSWEALSFSAQPHPRERQSSSIRGIRVRKPARILPAEYRSRWEITSTLSSLALPPRLIIYDARPQACACSSNDCFFNQGHTTIPFSPYRKIFAK